MFRARHRRAAFLASLVAALTLCAGASAATPAITTDGGGPFTIGQNGVVAIHDFAVLTGGTSTGGGAITFKLFADANCQTQVGNTSVINVTNGADGKNYTSGNITVSAPGTYHWTAAYSGDPNNTAAISGCGAQNENPIVFPRSTSVVTDAGGPYTIGANGTSALHDAATLTGGTSNASGVITFRLYSDTNCSTQVGSTSVVVNNGADSKTYTSADITVNVAGTYHWTAAYSGDQSNQASISSCNATNENPVVNPAPSVDHASNPNAAPDEPVSTNTTTSVSDPVGTTVTSPAGGSIDIAETQTLTTDPPSGITFLGWQVNITIPDGSPGSASNPLDPNSPLRIVFHIDSSLAPSGVLLYRDGVPFPDPPDCLAAGIASPEPCIESTTPTATGEDITVLAVHASGWNFSTADTTAPLISLIRPADGAHYVLGQSVVVAYSCSDPESGPPSCVGSLPNGASVPTGVSALGPHTFTVDSTSEGGSSSVSHDYKVVFGFVGFLPPYDAQPGLNILKPGPSIQVKFKLLDANGVSAYSQVGLNVLAPNYPRSTAINCTTRAPLTPLDDTATVPRSPFAYESKHGQYVYDWKIDKMKNCRRLQVKLTDGETYSADFKFK